MLNPEPRTLNPEPRVGSLPVVMHIAQRVSLVLLLAMVLAGVAGCPNGRPSPFEEPLPMNSVIERVNDNNRQMDFLLQGRISSATGRWRRGPDESAQSTSFDMKGALLYRKPRNLYLRLTHTLGGQLEAGSNEREFWVWERLRENRYWWGEHQWLKEGQDVDLPIRPDVLLDVLGVGDLPSETTGPRGPVLWVVEAEYQLIFMDVDETGQSYIAKVMDVGRRPPYLIDSIRYFNRDGVPSMLVRLSDYREVEGSKVLAPRRIEMRSLENDNHMTLEFASMKRFEQPEAQKLFISPMQRADRNLSYVRRVDGWRPSSRPVSSPATLPSAMPATQPGAVKP
jgi:hypothetical protein